MTSRCQESSLSYTIISGISAAAPHHWHSIVVILSGDFKTEIQKYILVFS